MKVFISVDMEGILSATQAEHVRSDGKEHGQYPLVRNTLSKFITLFWQ